MIHSQYNSVHLQKQGHVLNTTITPDRGYLNGPKLECSASPHSPVQETLKRPHTGNGKSLSCKYLENIQFY